MAAKPRGVSSAGRDRRSTIFDVKSLAEPHVRRFVFERMGRLRPGSKALWGCMSHPIFGMMRASEWQLSGYRHVDHHVRQFGV